VSSSIIGKPLLREMLVAIRYVFRICEARMTGLEHATSSVTGRRCVERATP
jgi:hypothetical protein